MSSFGKNLIPRRAHKERAQPAHRVSKHGLLEKKKDYKQRAADRNRKRLRLKLLKEKAAFRNPDEFYYAMLSSNTASGRVQPTQNRNEKDRVALANRDAEHRLLAQTQDQGYVSVKHALEQGTLAKLSKGLHFVSAATASGMGRRRVFVDDEEEMECVAEREMERVDDAPVASRALRKRLRKAQQRAYRELEQRVNRRDKLSTVLHDMTSERALLAKGRRYMVRPADKASGAPAVFRWHQERKR